MAAVAAHTPDGPPQDAPAPVVVVGSADSDPLARARLLPWYDPSVLAAASVVVVGVGALGNEVAKDLALAGVGTLVLVDPDVVEGSNLGRCCLFTAEDAAARRPKVAAASAGLRRMRPDGVPPQGLAVRTVQQRIESALDDPTAPLGAVSAAVGCLDNLDSRLTLSAWALHRRLPLADGAVSGLQGRVLVTPPGAAVCLECTLNATHRAALQRRYRCSGGEATLVERPQAAEVTTVAVVGAVVVRETLKQLLGQQRQALTGPWYYDGWTNEAAVLALQPSPQCAFHGQTAPPPAPSAGGGR